MLVGELTIAHHGALSVDALHARLHPAESRIRRLSLETPATFVAFDCLLAKRGKPLLHAPLSNPCRARGALCQRQRRGSRVCAHTVHALARGGAALVARARSIPRRRRRQAARLALSARRPRNAILTAPRAASIAPGGLRAKTVSVSCPAGTRERFISSCLPFSGLELFAPSAAPLKARWQSLVCGS